MVKRALAIALGVAAVLLVSLSAAPASAQTRHLVWFSSPSGNIGCWMGTDAVRCDVRVHTWKRPARPAGCRLDWGDSLILGRVGKAQWMCHGDTVLSSPRVLKYGDRSVVGRFVCSSKTTGMRCVNTRNGHGFLISRSKHQRF